METVAAMVRAVDAAHGDCAALVRVSDNDPVEIKRVLDRGPAGVIVPSVDTAAQAERAVAACRYPPEGVRWVAGYRAAENAADIAAVDGVDALFVGPADLSASLGAFGDVESAAFRDAIDSIVAGARGAGTPVGTLATSAENVAVRETWGVDSLATGVDTSFLRESARRYRDASDAARE